jgi:type IV pilus assembly protein PilQ
VTPGTGGQGQPAEAAAEPNAAVPAEVAARDSGLLDIHVRNVSLAALLELLSYEARANIVTSTSVNGRVSANLYGVTLEQALDALLTPNQYAYQVAGGTVFVGTPAEISALRPPPETRLFRLRHVQPDEAAQAVKAVLSPGATVVEGGREAAGGSGSSTSSGGSSTGTAPDDAGPTTGGYLIVTDLPDRLSAVQRLLAEIDQRPRQVLIEATILRATLNESNQFGIDFVVLGGVDFQNVHGTSNASADLQLGALPSSRLQHTTINANTRFANNVAAGGFTFGLIRDNIATFIRALEEVTDVVVVANPKIVSLNRREGQVIVGRRDGYLTTTVTQTAAIQTVDYLETGTQLRFRPTINDDGTVRLSVHPKDSNGGLTAANLPFEETTEAHADILMNDGDTVLIGGLFRERTVGSKSQVPGLGNLPLLGLLFQSRNDQTVREEVIILLTIHVLKGTAEEAEQFRGLIQDVERIRVGIRQGLLGTGRERLAQAHYREALRQLGRGKSGLALLNARMALSNQPRFLPAIRLKEQLLDQRVWDDEGSRMRTFIWRLLATDGTSSGTGEAPATLFGRPGLNGPPPEPPAEPAEPPAGGPPQ